MGSALLRILYAVVFVLLEETYPERLSRFQLGLVRCEAFLLSYLGSLVDRYPPLTLATEPAGGR